MEPIDGRSGWLRALRAYVAVTAGVNFIWEFAHMPLYTMWASPWQQVIFTGVHCTGGDILIAAAALWIGLIFAGCDRWPLESFRRVSLVTIAVGIGYTIFSEWLNVEVRRTWAYADVMPRIPPLGTGMSPFLQWCVVPMLALMAARRYGCGADCVVSEAGQELERCR